MIRFTDEQIASMRDGYPPPEYDCEQAITSLSAEVAELRRKLKVAEDALVSYRDFMRMIEKDKNIGIENRQENCFWADRLDSVIAAIREEGGTK